MGLRLLPPRPAAPTHVGHVLSSRAVAQMIDVDARRRVARVQGEQIARTEMMLEHGSVRVHLPIPSSSDLPVSLTVLGTDEQPATGWIVMARRHHALVRSQVVAMGANRNCRVGVAVRHDSLRMRITHAVPAGGSSASCDRADRVTVGRLASHHRGVTVVPPPLVVHEAPASSSDGSAASFDGAARSVRHVGPPCGSARAGAVDAVPGPPIVREV